jgi:LuxR family maltose regulon positive regulatory protein
MSRLTDPTKLTPPRYLEGPRRKQASPSNGPFSQPHLLDWLQVKILPGKTACLVAPEGSGKTTLVSSWMKSNQQIEQPLRFAWLSLDDGDNDIARFLCGLVTALQQAQPGLGITILAELDCPKQPNLPGLLAALLMEISASQASIYCVLDDFHAIISERLHQGVGFLASNLPPNLALVIVSDKDLPDPLKRLCQQEEWPVLGMEDLRFKPAHARAMLEANFKVKITDGQARTLTSRTQGLALAIHLAGLALQGHPSPDSFWQELKEADSPGLDFLLNLVWERQMEAVREFLLFTSLLNRLSGPLCDHILRASPSGLQAPGRGQASLEHLSKNRVLTYSLDNDCKWFRYHPLLAQMLRAKLEESYPGSMIPLHQRASQWAELNGDLEAAIHHALEAGDEERASVMVELNALTWIGQGELTTTLKWLGRLSAGLILLRPWLCLAEAWATADEGWQQGTETLLSVIETAAESMPPNAAQRARGHIAAIRFQLSTADKLTPQGEALARRALEFLPPQDRNVRCYIATHLGMDLRQLGKLSAAAEVLIEAVACANQGENRAFAVLALCRLADLHWVEGLFQKVLALSEEALFMAQNYQAIEKHPLLPAGFAHIYAGIAAYERDELEVAQSHFENSIAYCESWGFPEFVAAGQALLAWTYYARGNLSFARQTAEQSQDNLQKSIHLQQESPERVTRSPNFLAVQPEYTQARLASLYLTLGDHQKAIAWVEQNHYQDSDPVDFTRAPIYLSVAQVLLAQRRTLEARRLIRHLVSLSEATGAQNSLIRALALQAQLFQQSNDYQSGLATLKRALRLAESENYLRSFMDGNRDVYVLLRRLSESGPGSAYARSILAAADRQSQRSLGAGEPITLSPRPLTRPLSPVDRVARDALTDREKEVLRLLDSYLTVVEIAYRLSLSTRTVDTLVLNICHKLGARDARQAVARARELKIL